MDKDSSIKIQCSNCEEVYEAVKLPIDSRKLMQEIKKSWCPNCGRGAIKSYIWTGKADD